MDRSIFSAFISVLLGVSTAGTLGFALPATGGPEPSGRPEGIWHILEPVTYENISIFPVASSASYDTSYFLTLDEGLSSGEVLIREQGADGMARSREGAPRIIPEYHPEYHPEYRPEYRTGPAVNQLVLVNRSKRPLL